MVGIEYSEALVEVLDILDYLEEEEKSKIPNEIIEFFEKNKSKTYNPNIEYEADIEKLNIKNKTRQILAGLYIDYLCTEEEKQAYIKELRQNEIEYQQQIKDNYNEEDIFKNKRIENKKEVKEMASPQKENFFMKIIRKIKYFLNR